MNFISKLRTDAFKCYNICYGNCSTTCKTTNEVCLYCLENIRPNHKRELKDIALKDTNNKIIKSKIKTMKTFKFPIDLIEFPLKKNNPIEVKYKDKIYLLDDLKSIYGGYKIRTAREHTPFDTKTLLATLYFAYDFERHNNFENRIIENKLKDWLDLLEVQNDPYYIKKLISGLDFLTDATIYQLHAWDYENNKRIHFDKLKIKSLEDLPAFSIFHILNEFHHYKNKKGRSQVKIEVGDTFYSKIDQRFIYIKRLDEIIGLSDIELNLFLFLKKQYDKRTFTKIPYVFDLLKNHIGITDKNVTYAKRTFDNAFNSLKKKNLIEEYDYKIGLLDGVEIIRFEFLKSLKPNC